jgi:hypothetical protein
VLESLRPELETFLKDPALGSRPFLLPKGEPHAAFVESLQLPHFGHVPNLFLHRQGSRDFVFAEEFDACAERVEQCYRQASC